MRSAMAFMQNEHAVKDFFFHRCIKLAIVHDVAEGKKHDSYKMRICCTI